MASRRTAASDASRYEGWAVSSGMPDVWRQDLPDRDPLSVRRVAGEVCVDVVVERQFLLLLQLKYRGGGELLGDRPDPVDGLGRCRHLSLDIREPVSIGEHDGSSARDGDGEPGHVRLAQQSLRGVVHPGGQTRIDPDERRACSAGSCCAELPVPEPRADRGGGQGQEHDHRENCREPEHPLHDDLQGQDHYARGTVQTERVLPRLRRKAATRRVPCHHPRGSGSARPSLARTAALPRVRRACSPWAFA
jgi:hypothetical protein